MSQAQTSCQLYLVVGAGDGAAQRLSAALEAAQVATVLVAAGSGRTSDVQAAKPLIAAARRLGVVALMMGDPTLVRDAGADGVHLPSSKTISSDYRDARAALGEKSIVGIDAGVSRHDAMTLADAGADYVAFGAPAHLKDRDKGRIRRDELVAWWSEIFQVPCVAFDVGTAQEAEALARAGADFVAVTLGAGMSPADARWLIGDIAAAIRPSEEAA